MSFLKGVSKSSNLRMRMCKFHGISPVKCSSPTGRTFWAIPSYLAKNGTITFSQYEKSNIAYNSKPPSHCVPLSYNNSRLCAYTTWIFWSITTERLWSCNRDARTRCGCNELLRPGSTGCVCLRACVHACVRACVCDHVIAWVCTHVGPCTFITARV